MGFRLLQEKGKAILQHSSAYSGFIHIDNGYAGKSSYFKNRMKLVSLYNCFWQMARAIYSYRNKA